MNFDYNILIEQHLYLIYLGVFLVAAAIISFEIQSKKTSAVLLLITGAIALRVFVVLIDPFLHMWDEQVHALVARNMMTHPFKPTFINNPIFPVDHTKWAENHIWLHKQPFFLWQIALFFKLFGVSELSLRIPNLLMSGITVFFIYRIGKILYSKYAGFYAAVLFAGSNYLIELTAGRMPTDHNDFAFFFYVTASIWAWFEYINSNNKKWLIIIGLFSGIAILNKWLTGLLVYSGWFLVIILNKEWRKTNNSYTNFLKSLIITILVALPWQIYVLIKFPLESRYEFAYNSLHFFEAVEGHGGSWLFHYEAITDIYGNNFIYVILASLIVFCFARINKIFKVAMLSWIITVYAFFTLAETKMMGFTTIVAPVIFLAIGLSIAYLIDGLKNRINQSRKKTWLPKIIASVVVFSLFFHFLNHEKLSLENTPNRKKVFSKAISRTLVYKDLISIFPDENYYIFNTVNNDHAKVMFYTNHMASSGVPTIKELKELKNHGYKTAVFDDGKLPEYIMNDTEIAKIRSSLWPTSFIDKIEVYY